MTDDGVKPSDKARPDAERWVLLKLLPIPMLIVAGLCYLVGLHLWIIAGTLALMVIFSLIAEIPASRGRGAGLTPRRAIVFYGVIPASAGLIALLLLAAEVEGWVVGVSVFAVVIAGNVIFDLWFDDG